ncbi:MAG TPA: DUF429 domain-containing protein [Actinomycetes bacterium]|nr:DUF429 domain-containing protein [Actinomycetes bacterium]
MTVVGIDACRGGWVGIVLDDSACPTGAFGRSVAELLETMAPVDLIAIDIPIGLPDSGSRAADHAARAAVGPRWHSVFLTPIRAALTAPTYLEANRLARQHGGAGISRQAYGLRGKILEVDTWLAHAPAPVFEVHPELCFATMASAPLISGKKSWTGMQRRRRLLRSAGIELADDLGEAGRRAAADDVLDAAAAAWSARRLLAGIARPLPDPPAVGRHGRPVAIWV